MKTSKRHQRTGILTFLVLFALLAVVMTGCGEKEAGQDAEPSAGTAKGSLDLARSALETMAPDAKLLVVQTAEPITETSTPVWAYLFGSPETDTTYMVYVSEGKAMGASEYGSAGLSDEEWQAVPDTSGWEVDSDDAYEKAIAEAGGDTQTSGYFMGLQTYVPRSASETDTTRSMTWYISLDVARSAEGLVAVDAKTGEATRVENPAQ